MKILHFLVGAIFDPLVWAFIVCMIGMLFTISIKKWFMVESFNAYLLGFFCLSGIFFCLGVLLLPSIILFLKVFEIWSAIGCLKWVSLCMSILAIFCLNAIVFLKRHRLYLK